MKKFILALCILFALPAWGQSQIALSFGPSLDGATNPKYASLGYEYLFSEVSLLGECAGIFESPTNLVCGAVISARIVSASGLFARVGVGPAYALNTDDRLSSHGEFDLQGAVGLAQNGWDIGVKFQHYSNAGLVPPNPGRDFLAALLEIGF